jgi:hypothetical protein
LGGEECDLLLAVCELRIWRAPAADAAQLTAGLVGPQARTERLEDGEGLLERRARWPLLVCLSAHRPQREQRPSALEGVGDAIQLVQGTLDRGRGTR